MHCRHPHGGPGAEEEGRSHSLVLPVTGVFVRHVRGRTVVGSAAQLLFFNRGEPYRVSHPQDGGDDCLTLAFSEAALRDVLGAVDPAAPDRRDGPFRRTHLPMAPEEALAFHGLRHRLARGEAQALEAEERALALLARAARRASEAPSPHGLRADTRRRRQAWAEAVQLLLAQDPAADRSLTDLARAVACSPFHLARSFQAEVGQPIHRYALRQRLLLSLEPLAEGVRELTALALDLGFASHSHFSASFQRTFGLSPSAFRAQATGRALRELRKIVKA